MMKLSIKILFAAVLASGFTGCLKDDELMDPSQSQNVIEFANSANLTSPTTSKIPLLTVNITMDPGGSHNAIVSYSGAHETPQDINVEVAVADNAVITAYNTQNSRSYVPLPSNLYNMPATKVTIKKGERRALIPINFVNGADLYNKNYVLALTIKSASYGTISGNFGTMLYLINGVNRYDGIYTLKYRFGTNDRNYDTQPVTWFFSDVQLVTTGNTTTVMRNMNVGSPYAHGSTINGLPNSIANFTPVLTFDLSNNKITNIANSVTSGSPPKTAVPNPAVTDNRADMTSRNIYASFILKESGKQDMIINDTLIYKGPR
ncbi:MAG TPA: DUF1735 domain-containing protein [Chitinophagaceae bacterium]|nr:DUF1735 domain-containing protein [Chitinophagaceae bacterium]